MRRRSRFATLARSVGETGIDQFGRLSGRMVDRTLRLERHTEWSDELDGVLAMLPPLPDTSVDAYRELLRPTGTPKMHLVASDAGEPVCLLSLRRRGNFWEPVTHQCLPGQIAPARSTADLGRALRAAGVEIRVESGLDESSRDLGSRWCYPYDVYQVDLHGDYRAHWREKGRKKSIRTAQKRTAHLDVAVDAPGGLERTIERWHDSWQGHERDEVAAAPDRLRFWSALRDAPRSEDSWCVHTIELVDGDRAAAGTILLVRDGFASFQCVVRDPADERAMVGTRIVEVAVDWARDQGLDTFDLGGGGGYKRWWGPVATQRYGVIFRPPTTELAYSLGRVVRSARDNVSRQVASARGESNGDS